MKVYFKKKVGSNSIKYSLEKFDKTESLECNVEEYDISDYFNEEEALALCEKSCEEYFVKGVSIEKTLNDCSLEKEKQINSLKFQEKFTSINTKQKFINFSVYLVYRGNFNDEMLIADYVFDIASMNGNNLKWIDLYLGKLPNNDIKIAPVFLDGNDLYLLEEQSSNVKVVKKQAFTMYYSDDYDEKYIISTHIEFRNR